MIAPSILIIAKEWNTNLVAHSAYEFYFDYGFADEDAMEGQIYVLPEESIKYPPF